MVAPNQPTLSDARKLAIQGDVTRLFPSGIIGVEDDERQEVFASLYDRLTEKHFRLMQLGRDAVYPFADPLSAKFFIVQDSLRFYAERKDHLSVTDYVTDFLDIVAMRERRVAILRD